MLAPFLACPLASVPQLLCPELGQLGSTSGSPRRAEKQSMAQAASPKPLELGTLLLGKGASEPQQGTMWAPAGVASRALPALCHTWGSCYGSLALWQPPAPGSAQMPSPSSMPCCGGCSAFPSQHHLGLLQLLSRAAWGGQGCAQSTVSSLPSSSPPPHPAAAGQHFCI